MKQTIKFFFKWTKDGSEQTYINSHQGKQNWNDNEMLLPTSKYKLRKARSVNKAVEQLQVSQKAGADTKWHNQGRELFRSFL